MTRAQRLNNDTSWGDITVVLTDNAGITDINRQVFNRATSTDVIALRYAPLPGVETHATAELFINVERACQYPRRRGWNVAKELALYIAHGCDHLAGAIDDTDTQRKRMRRRELRWLREAQAQGLIEDLLV